MKIVAIDPGAHVGIAIREDDGTLSVGMIHNNIGVVAGKILDLNPDVIVVERFATGGRLSRYGHETIEIVGVCRGLAYACVSKFVIQTPQFRIAFMAEARKQIGKGATQHAYDALAHLLSWEYHNAQ